MLTGRATASGRSRRDMHLLAVLNVSHQFAEAAAALRATGERVPPLVTDEIDRFGDAVLDEHGPGSGVLGLGGRRRRAARAAAAGHTAAVVVLAGGAGAAGRDGQPRPGAVGKLDARPGPARPGRRLRRCPSGCERGRSGSSSS